MRRVGFLMARVTDSANLRLAFWKAARGKRGQGVVRRFAANLDEELSALRDRLLRGEVGKGGFHRFVVHDPKRRVIHAAGFRDRVLHHALMNPCEEVLERRAIDDSYACRRGKGRHAAIARAQGFARRFPYVIKLDIAGYFDSIDHDVLRGQLTRMFKDRSVLAVFSRIIRGYETEPGRGLPIGTLTSQHLANAYLGPMDRFIKEGLRCKGYLRYMDDFLLFGTDPGTLERWRDETASFLATRLRLQLKRHPEPLPTRCGTGFLGVRVLPGAILLGRRARRRSIRKLEAYEDAYCRGELSELELQQRGTALFAFLCEADSAEWRKEVLLAGRGDVM